MLMTRQAFFLALAATLAFGTGTAHGQPATKLVTGLDKALISNVWCSALFFEESFWHDSDSERAYYYEDLAYLLEDDMHAQLLDSGLGEPEIAELWEVFDAAAMDLAVEDETGYRAQLAPCETQFRTLLPLPKD